MPIGFNSPARNFFLLGSSGVQTATNFFKAIDQSSTADGYFNATGIKYSSYDEKYILSGSADNSQAISFGFLEKREEDGTLDWNNRIQSSLPSGKLDLTSLELDTNGDLIVGGLSNSAPWIAKYSNTGGLVWLSTTNTGDARYFGIGIDSSNNYYAAGRTERNNLTNPTDTNRSNAVVEKYDSNGNPLWGKSVSIGAENASFQKVDVSDTSVICAGYIEDNVTKGYFAKYDSASGVLQWDRTLESKEIDGLGIQEKTSIEDIHVDSDGFIYLCGVLSFDEVESNTFNQSRGFITKYTPEGNQLWCREVGIPNFSAYVQYYNIKVDDNTKQVIVFGISSNTNSTKQGLLTKLSSSGKILWHRELLSDRVPPTVNEFQRRVGFDADASFYYIFFTDDDFNKSSGTPDEYTFGKVSSSGNGLGSFVYNPEVGIDIEYTISSIPNRIGKLQDGSVRNDSSDFISYPFNGTKIMFDDLATPVTNKKAIISDKDIILRSGSPAIRPADFQELNLLGDVYSGSGDWLDQSGKGNDGIIPLSGPFAGSGSLNFPGGSTDRLEIANSADFNFGTGAYTIEMLIKTTASAGWLYHENDPNDSGMRLCVGTNGSTGSNDGRIEFNEQVSNGDNAIQGSTQINDGQWHHIAVVRGASGDATKLYVDGVLDATGSANRNFDSSDTLYIGARGTYGGNEYAGKISNLRVVKGVQVYTGNFTQPSAPLDDVSGTSLLIDGSSITDTSSNNRTITVNGNAAPTDDGPTHNAAGYWEFDGVDDYISLGTQSFITTQHSVEMWVNISADKEHYIFSFGYQDDNSALLFLDTSNQELLAVWRVGGANQTSITTGELLSLNQWYHILWTRDGATNKIYLDGVEVGSSTTQTTISLPACIYDIGWATTRDKAAAYTQGKIGDVRVYPRALTAAQVYQNYNATKTKYINEAPDTAPKISPGIVIDSNLLLNYDFGNRATYDRAENLIAESIPDPTSGLTSPAYWTSQEFQTPTRVKSPFGSNDAYQYLANAGNVRSRLVSAGSSSAVQLDSVVGEQYVFSIFVKAINYDIVNWGSSSAPWGTASTGNTRIEFNLSTGTVTADLSGKSVSSASMIDYGDGWWRLVVVTNVVTNATGYRLYLDLGSVQVNADTHTTSEGYQVYGAQVEVSTTPGRHIRTYGSAITAPTTVKNLSSSSYPGTINGATSNSDGYFEFVGPPGLGAGDYINIGTTSTFKWIHDRTESDWAIEGWYWNNRDEEYGAMISNNSGTSTVGFYMGQRNDEQFECVINKGTQGTQACRVLSTNGLDHDTWYHIAFVNDNYTIKLYVNGVLQSNGGDQNSFSTSSTANAQTDLRIAKLGDSPAWNLDGKIGAIRIYQTSLSADEVSQNFNATKSKYGL